MSSANYQASWQSATAAAPPSVTIEQDTNSYRDNGERERLKNVRGILIPTVILWLICLLTSLAFGAFDKESRLVFSELFQYMTAWALAFFIAVSPVPIGYACRQNGYQDLCSCQTWPARYG